MWNPSQYGRQRGFDKFIPEGYEGFEQFMSGKSYRVNLDYRSLNNCPPKKDSRRDFYYLNEDLAG